MLTIISSESILSHITTEEGPGRRQIARLASSLINDRVLLLKQKSVGSSFFVFILSFFLRVSITVAYLEANK